MEDNQPSTVSGLVVRKNQGLLMIPDEEHGEPVTRLYVEDFGAEPGESDETLQAALNAIGAWADLDWEETLEDLDRIRHGSVPTSPIDLDDAL